MHILVHNSTIFIVFSCPHSLLFIPPSTTFLQHQLQAYHGEPITASFFESCPSSFFGGGSPGYTPLPFNSILYAPAYTSTILLSIVQHSSKVSKQWTYFERRDY